MEDKMQVLVYVFVVGFLGDHVLSQDEDISSTPLQSCVELRTLCKPYNNTPATSTSCVRCKTMPGKRGKRGPKGDTGVVDQTFLSTLQSRFDNQQTLLSTLQSRFDNQQTRLVTLERENTALKAKVQELERISDKTATVAQRRCPGASYTFARDGQITDYVRYRGSFPALKNFTMCAWVKIDKDGVAAVASYAISGRDNELLWEYRNPRTQRLIVGDYRSHDFHASQRSDRQTFYCMSYNYAGKVMMDTSATGTDTANFAAGLGVRGGGSLIVGQEQDRVDGGFDARQSFRGKIANLMIWPRLLTEREVHDIAYSCVCPTDFVVAMTLDQVELHGDVTYSATEECPTL